MRQVTINGKQYDVKFTMGIARTYELIMNERSKEEEKKKLHDILLAIGNGDEGVILDVIDLMLKNAGAPKASDLGTIAEYTEVVSICSQALADYFKDDNPHKPTTGEEQDSKN